MVDFIFRISKKQDAFDLLESKLQNITSDELKNHLSPYADNDYIRNNIYSYAEANPHKRIDLTRFA